MLLDFALNRWLYHIWATLELGNWYTQQEEKGEWGAYVWRNESLFNSICHFRHFYSITSNESHFTDAFPHFNLPLTTRFANVHKCFDFCCINGHLIDEKHGELFNAARYASFILWHTYLFFRLTVMQLRLSRELKRKRENCIGKKRIGEMELQI